MDEASDDIFEPMEFRWDEEEFVAAEAVRAFCAAMGKMENEMVDHGEEMTRRE